MECYFTLSVVTLRRHLLKTRSISFAGHSNIASILLLSFCLSGLFGVAYAPSFWFSLVCIVSIMIHVSSILNNFIMKTSGRF